MTIRPTMHQLSPSPENVRVRWNDVVRLRNAVQASLDFVGLHSILLPRDLDAGLYVSDRHCREMQSFVRGILNPGHHALTRLRLAELGHDVRVQQVHG
jgi:hypothetical protein